MKKYIAFFVALLLALTGLTALAEDTSKVNIVATIFPQYDFARAIAGDAADITMLLRPGAESHSFEPTPRDIITVQEADVFLFVGGHNDQWIYDLLGTMDTSNMHTLELLACVDAKPERVVEGMAGNVPGEESAPDEHDHDHEDHDAHDDHDHDAPDDPLYAGQNATYHHHEDEHVWTSPVMAMDIVRAITEVIAQADPGNRAYYEANRDEYLDELAELDAAFRDVVDHAARKTFVMGDRFPLRYLADEYGLTYYAAFPGCATDTEVSAGTMAYIIDKVNEEELPVVFYMELSNHKIADAIAESTGAKTMLLHSAHNLSKGDFDAGLTYLDIMRANVAALKEALG